MTVIDHGTKSGEIQRPFTALPEEILIRNVPSIFRASLLLTEVADVVLVFFFFFAAVVDSP